MVKKNKIIRLNGDNYSELFSDFSNLFIKDFPDHYDIWEILDLSMEIWNMANLKKIVPEDQFVAAMSLVDELGETSQLFEKMMDYKAMHYGDFNKFIIDCEFDLEEEPLKFEVVTGDIDAYMKRIEEFEDNEEYLEENIVNRNAIILKPKKPFVDWVKKINEEEDDEIFIMETKIYLVNDEASYPEEWLEENFDKLFIKELEEWELDESTWPKNRSFTMFKKWFKVGFSIMVYDMENTKISKGII